MAQQQRQNGKGQAPRNGKSGQSNKQNGEQRKSGGSSGFNRAMVIGNLGADPEVRFLESGQAVCNFSVATSERWTDKNGEAQERVEWHRIVVWGKMAESCGEYLAKGRQVFVEGRLQTRKWTDDADVEHYTTEINASSVKFLGGKPKDGQQERPKGRPTPHSSEMEGTIDDQDGIPF